MTDLHTRTAPLPNLRLLSERVVDELLELGLRTLLWLVERSDPERDHEAA